MGQFLGIDHPLVVVRDLPAVAERYAALGFAPRPLGRHPWGTTMRLVQFDGCSIELMGVEDEGLLDQHAIDGFSFGRYIHDQLQEREGIALLALNSADAEADAGIVTARGITCQGTINFGRDIRLEDGRHDRTSTTLKILVDPKLPRLGNFAVQQHRPDLIFRPDWLLHPNGAIGIHQVTIMAEPAHWPAVRQRLAGLYGDSALFQNAEGFGARTGNGRFVVLDKAAVERTYAPLPPELAAEPRPCCVAIHITVPDTKNVLSFLASAGAAFTTAGSQVRLRDAKPYGNVFLAFDTAPRTDASAD
jgi:hypothetical protein